MKTEKEIARTTSGKAFLSGKAGNPFIKLMEDKERIEKAVKNGEPLSSLKDIKFVRPI